MAATCAIDASPLFHASLPQTLRRNTSAFQPSCRWLWPRSAWTGLPPIRQVTLWSRSSRCAPSSQSSPGRSLTVRASSADMASPGSGGNVGKGEGEKAAVEPVVAPAAHTVAIAGGSSDKAGVQLAWVIGAVASVAALGAVVATFASGGPAAVVSAFSKSGFSAAFALIFVSEIGDKTFFIAALLAMRHSRLLVITGSIGALSLMTIISVGIGRLFHKVPEQFSTTVPLGEYAAVALLVYFGIRSLKAAWDLPPVPEASKDGGNIEDDLGELREAEELVQKEESQHKITTPWQVLVESFSLVFLAEWGDRSMLATIALGAAQSPVGVASGAILGHLIATGIAVLGGSFLAHHISEKVVGYTSGALFLLFAIATLTGVF